MVLAGVRVVSETNDPDHLRLREREIEKDTRILAAKFIRLDGVPVLIEEWNWEAINGSTAVFLAEHVAGTDDDAVQEF